MAPGTLKPERLRLYQNRTRHQDKKAKKKLTPRGAYMRAYYKKNKLKIKEKKINKETSLYL